MIVAVLPCGKSGDPANRASRRLPNHYTMIVGVLRNSLRSLARRPGKTLFFLIIIP